MSKAKALARRTDPDTSKEAAKGIVSNLWPLQRRALRLIERNPGMIARQLSHLAGDPDPRTINRRLGELERAGMARRGEPKRCEITGRMCATWWPAKDGPFTDPPPKRDPVLQPGEEQGELFA